MLVKLTQDFLDTQQRDSKTFFPKNVKVHFLLLSRDSVGANLISMLTGFGCEAKKDFPQQIAFSR